MPTSDRQSAIGREEILAALAQLHSTTASFQQLAAGLAGRGRGEPAATAGAAGEQTRAQAWQFSARMAAYLRARAAQAHAEGLHQMAAAWEADAAAIERAAAWAAPGQDRDPPEVP